MTQEASISSDPPRPLIGPGTTFDRYEVVGKLAQGGMATVWIARQRGKHGFEQLVAIKTILPDLVHDDPFRNMFLDEARIAARINHTNIARIFDLGEKDQILYHVMEWIEGDVLAKLSRRAKQAGRAIPPNVFLRILAGACAGLHAAHELTDLDGSLLEVVHRDVSPQNIIVSVDGNAKVIDFGIARANKRLSEATTFGVIKGKIHYMAPEQARGEVVSRAADIWAIGAMLYEYFAKRHIYVGESEVHVMTKLVTSSPIDPMPDEVPRPIRDIVTRALSPRPNDRFATMAELREAIEAAMVETDCRATTGDVAAFVKEVAGAGIESRRERVRAAIRALDNMTSSPDEPLLESSPALPVISMGEERTAQTSIPSEIVETTQPLVKESTTTTTTSRPGSRWVGLVGFGAILLFGGIAISRMVRDPSTAAQPIATTAEPVRLTTTISLPPPSIEPTPSTTASASGSASVVITQAPDKPPATREVSPPDVAPARPTVSASSALPPAATPSIEPPVVATAAPVEPPAPMMTSVSPPPPQPPPATPTPPSFDARHARVVMGAVQGEHGVRKRDVQSVVSRAVPRMTECYQSDLVRVGRAQGGPGTLRIETDMSGRIVRATAEVGFSAAVARCVERSVVGSIIAGVDTGEAVASVSISFEP